MGALVAGNPTSFGEKVAGAWRNPAMRLASFAGVGREGRHAQSDAIIPDGAAERLAFVQKGDSHLRPFA